MTFIAHNLPYFIVAISFCIFCIACVWWDNQ